MNSWKQNFYFVIFSDYGDECEGWKLLNQDTFRDFKINTIWAMYAVNTLQWKTTNPHNSHVHCTLYCTQWKQTTPHG